MLQLNLFPNIKRTVNQMHMKLIRKILTLKTWNYTEENVYCLLLHG